MTLGRLTYDGQPVEDQIAQALWDQAFSARMAAKIRASRRMVPIVLRPAPPPPPWLARIRELVATPAEGATP